MTAQAPNTLEINGHTYGIIATEGEGLLTPSDFGIQPVMMSTACWRGYITHYAIVDGVLTLVGLRMCAEEDQYKPIAGIEPTMEVYEPVEGKRYAEAVYSDLAIRTHFSGAMLAGRDFVDVLYRHMAFQKPWGYRVLLEVVVADGRVERVQDHSDEARGIRTVIAQMENPRDVMDFERKIGQDRFPYFDRDLGFT